MENQIPVLIDMGDYNEFLDQIVSKSEINGINLDTFELDHLCFRCSSMPEYLSWFTRLIQHHTLVVESMIGGRPIPVFEINPRLKFRLFLKSDRF